MKAHLGSFNGHRRRCFYPPPLINRYALNIRRLRTLPIVRQGAALCQSIIFYVKATNPKAVFFFIPLVSFQPMRTLSLLCVCNPLVLRVKRENNTRTKIYYIFLFQAILEKLFVLKLKIPLTLQKRQIQVGIVKVNLLPHLPTAHFVE